MNGYVERIERHGRRDWTVIAVVDGTEYTLSTTSLREAKELLAVAGADWVVV